MAASTKTRQPRLRASCDGCFLAKVKCSKERPLCSRCLACGIDCRYSPSSRAGKPKADHHSTASMDRRDFARIHGFEAHPVYLNYPAVSQLPAEHMFHANNGWLTPPGSVEGTINCNPSIASNLSHFGPGAMVMSDEGLISAAANAAVDSYAAPMPWTPPSDISYQLGDMPMASSSPMSSTHARSLSLDSAISTGTSWTEPISPQSVNFGSTTMPAPSLPTSFAPAPTPPGGTRQSFSGHVPSSPIINSSSCTCFTACLQTLQALHNASYPAIPPFDHVLSLNGKAVEGCAAMLSCMRCMSRSGRETSTMLLATILGKIASFYRSSSAAYFGSGASGADGTSSASATNHAHETLQQQQQPQVTGSVSYGVYQLNGEDGKWFELEILSRELRKLDEVYARFREVCAEFSDNIDVNNAMVGYIGQNLVATLELVNLRRG